SVAALRTLATVSALAICPFSAREAEAMETPACAATCVMVTRTMWLSLAPVCKRFQRDIGNVLIKPKECQGRIHRSALCSTLNLSSLAVNSILCSTVQMRWQGQTLDDTDTSALPGLENRSGIVQSVSTPEFAG